MAEAWHFCDYCEESGFFDLQEFPNCQRCGTEDMLIPAVPIPNSVRSEFKKMVFEDGLKIEMKSSFQRNNPNILSRRHELQKAFGKNLKEMLALIPSLLNNGDYKIPKAMDSEMNHLRDSRKEFNLVPRKSKERVRNESLGALFHHLFSRLAELHSDCAPVSQTVIAGELKGRPDYTWTVQHDEYGSSNLPVELKTIKPQPYSKGIMKGRGKIQASKYASLYRDTGRSSYPICPMVFISREEGKITFGIHELD